MSKSKQPSLILDAVIKSLEEATSQLKLLNGEAKKQENVPEEPKEPKVNNVKLGILAYRKLFNERFGALPYLTAADNFQLGRLYSDLPDFEQVVTAYLNLDDKFIVDNGYAPRFIASRVGAIRLKLKSNASNPGGEWK